MPLEWKDTYRVGHADIDAQHQELLRRVVKLIAACTLESRVDCANSLNDHTREHFMHEESLMRSLHFPGIENHIDDHKNLLSKLELIASQIAEETLEHGELEVFITDWMLTHMVTFDAQLSVYMTS